MSGSVEPILIAEDDDNDAFLLKRAIQKCPVQNPVRIVSDGELAIRYLTEAEQRITPVPAFILTDLKMPKKSGFDVLEWTRQREKFSLVPIVVWSSSRNISDVEKAYRLGASTYFVKPPNVTDLEKLVAKIFEYWVGSEKAHLLQM